MGKNKTKEKSKIYQVGFSNINEKIKYVMPVDEFNIDFLQLNYNKYKLWNNDNIVPLWSAQRNTFESNYYEFEIFAGSDGNPQSHGVSDSMGEMTKEVSTYTKNINTTNKLNKTDEEIDFTTYMKIVNVFKEPDTAIAGSAKDQSLVDNVVIDQESFVKIVDHKTTGKGEAVNTDPLITLCATSGEKLKVTMSNFHGFWTSGDSVQCRVCMVMVEDVEAHKMEIRHMKRIASTIKNVHCVRKIGPILNHCLLCNEIIENIEFHLKANAAHTKHLEKALKLCTPEMLHTNTNQLKNSSNQNVVHKSVIQKVKSPTDVAYCKVCQRKMHTNNLQSHERGKYHKKMLDTNTKDPLAKLRDEDQQQKNDNVKIKHTYTNNASDIRIKPINNTVAENLKYLMIDAAHTKQLVYANAVNRISKYQTSSNVYTASVGNTVKRDLISIPEITYTNANQSINNPNQIAVDKSLIEMVNNPIQMVNNPSNIHINLKNTETSQKRILTNHLIVSTSKDSAVNIDTSNFTSNDSKKISFCNVCARNMQSVQLKAHIEGKYHKAQLLKIKNKEIKKRSQNCYLPSVKEIKIKCANQYQPKEISVSDKTVIKNFKLLENKEKHSHVNISTNNFTSNESEKLSFCNVCDRKMQSVQLKAHIKGKHHKAQLLRIKNKDIKEVAQNCHLPSVIGIKNEYAIKDQSNGNSVSDKTVIQKFKILEDKEANGTKNTHLAIDNNIINSTSSKSSNVAYCKVCNRKMHFNDLKSHEEGKYHKEMLANTTKSKDNSEGNNVKADVICEIGLTSIPENLDHIFQKNLQRKLHNGNGDRYDDVMLNSLIDTCSELRPSHTNQQKFSDNFIKWADTISAVNAKTLSNTLNPEKLKYLMTDTKSDCFYNCKVCSVLVLKNVKNDIHVMHHVNGARHIKEYTFLLKQNKLKIENENMLYCEVCKVFMCVTTELAHINMEHHKIMMANKVKDKNVIFNMADKKTTLDNMNKITHLKTLSVANGSDSSIRHERESEFKAKNNNANGFENTNSKSFALNEYLFNVKNNSRNALEGEKSAIDVEYSTCYKVSRNAIESNCTNSPLLAHCSRCGTILYSSNILDVLSRTAYYIRECCKTAIFTKHCIMVVDYDRVRCCYCSEYLHYSFGLEVCIHIMTHKHLYKLLHFPIPYSICYQMESNLDRLICKICKVTVARTVYDVLLHLELGDHGSKYDKLLSDSKIKVKGHDMFYCEPCNVHVPRLCEIDHINDNYHKIMLEKSKSALLHLELGDHGSKYDKFLSDSKIQVKGHDMFYCEPCNVDVPRLCVIEHINNNYHKIMLEKSKSASLFEFILLCGCIFVFYYCIV